MPPRWPQIWVPWRSRRLGMPWWNCLWGRGPQSPPRPLRTEPYYPPPKKKYLGKLTGLNLGTGALRGVNLGTGALRGLNWGAGACTRLWSGAGANTGASSGAGADTGASSGLEWAATGGLDFGAAGRLERASASGLDLGFVNTFWFDLNTSCLLLLCFLSLSAVKSILYSLFSILKSILYTNIFVSITCEYIPYRILQQKQSERLVITSFILISRVRY